VWRKFLKYSILIFFFFLRKFSIFVRRQTIALSEKAVKYRAGSEPGVIADLIDREGGGRGEQFGGML